MDVGIQYLSGLISEGSLKEIREIASINNLELKEKDISGVAFAHAGEIATFFFFLSPAFMEGVVTGVVSNTTYDAVKSMISIAANSISGKEYSTIAKDKNTKKMAKFHLRGGKVELIIEIPGNNLKAIDSAIDKTISAYKDANK